MHYTMLNFLWRKKIAACTGNIENKKYNENSKRVEIGLALHIKKIYIDRYIMIILTINQKYLTYCLQKTVTS